MKRLNIISAVLVAAAFCGPTISTQSLAQSSRPVIAVGEISSNISGFDSGSVQVAVENALAKTKKFTIMERTRLEALLREQGLSIAGITSAGKKLGGFSGVDYLIYGSITNASLENNNLLIMRECEAKMSMSIRVVDVKTAEIRLSESITVKEGVNTTPTDQNPCSGVSIGDINFLGANGADLIANKLTMTIFPIKVAKVGDAGEVYINYGEGQIPKDGTLKVVRMGEGFVDPDSGERIGAEETLVGVITISEVKAGFSIGRIIASREQIKVGDIATLGDKGFRRNADSCIRAEDSRLKSCTQDSASSSCQRAASKSESTCAVLFGK
jgi:hypothetical protein